MSKLRDWFNRTPTVDGPTKEELRKANTKLTQLSGGGSYVERPPKQSVIKNTIPSNWNKEMKEDKPIEKDIMKEIEWEYSEEGAKELRQLFAMWHLNDEVWQKKRRKAINLAVYGDEDAFDERPYYHLYTFNDGFGYKKQTYPKYKKDVAIEMYKHCKKGMDKGIIGDTILLEGYNVEED
ncbi:hypothetical protein H1N69_gp48 [Lactococcus phage phiQ1]|uniref:Uncharacterized protein n=1 Tax=Lactococcus phage phiQ1 TaxID=2488571 RepID=A0A455VJD1_9CAUD|nr:hypothetical protein H1N69_gp48 [Lactococcus phage phiQ1]BBI90342.1 unnamed protein product [Lactococcus phage phiQ1]